MGTRAVSDVVEKQKISTPASCQVMKPIVCSV